MTSIVDSVRLEVPISSLAKTNVSPNLNPTAERVDSSSSSSSSTHSSKVDSITTGFTTPNPNSSAADSNLFNDPKKLHVNDISPRSDHKIPKVSTLQQVQATARIIGRGLGALAYDVKTIGSVVKPVSETDAMYHYIIERGIRQVEDGDQWVYRGTEAAKPRSNFINENEEVKSVINCTSNAYYGLDVPAVALQLYKELTASGLPLSTSNDMTRKLASEVEAWFRTLQNSDHARVISSGYNANLLGLSAMVTPETVILLDEKSHNSMFVAARCSGAHAVKRFAHDDYKSLEKQLKEWRAKDTKHVIVMTEGLFSMEGAVPDLAAIAQLKQKHGFELFVDECHSILTVGQHGTGVYEYFRDLGHEFADPIDMRTWGTAKSMGNVGGAVTCTAKYAAALDKRYDELLAEGMEPMMLLSLVSNLLHQHTHVLAFNKLARLRHMARHIRKQFTDAGLFIYGQDTIPLIPIHVGTQTAAFDYAMTLKHNGLVAPLIPPPAVHKLACRVRFCMNGAFGDEHVVDAVHLTLKCAAMEGLIPEPPKTKPYAYPGHVTSAEEHSEVWTRAVHSVRQVIQQAAKLLTAHPAPLDTVIQTQAASTLDRFLLCAPAARWPGGTVTPHTELETMLRREFKSEEAFTSNELYAAQLSFSRALARPVNGAKRHLHLIPADAPSSWADGRMTGPRHRANKHLTYKSTDELVETINSVRGKGNHASIFFTLRQASYAEDCRGLDRVFAALDAQVARGSLRATILIDDCGFGTEGPRKLGIIDTLIKQQRMDSRERKPKALSAKSSAGNSKVTPTSQATALAALSMILFTLMALLEVKPTFSFGSFVGFFGVVFASLVLTVKADLHLPVATHLDEAVTLLGTVVAQASLSAVRRVQGASGAQTEQQRIYARNQKLEVIVMGSWKRAFGLPGVWTVGPKTIMDEMRWASVSFMFSSALPPVVSTLAQGKLTKLLQA